MPDPLKATTIDGRATHLVAVFCLGKLSASSAWRCAEDGGKVVLEQPLEETHHGWRIVSRGDIVVGVDQSPEARWAVLWGAREARLRGASLALAHVRSSVNDDRDVDDLESETEALLIVRAAEASEIEPDISVASRLYKSGSISEQLIELSGAADLLVLGVASARPRAEHGLLGPMEDRVVVHAHCPVVTVNGPGSIVGEDYDKIVLGWAAGTTGRRALEAAAEEAALRGSLLSIVTIPPTATPSPTLPSDRMNVEEALIDSMRRIESTYPGLQIDVTHRSGYVDTELEQSLDRAALLVLGSHHSEQSWSIRIGPIAEALMRRSPCPVMLVGRRALQQGTD
jgi:nucleotide-binding universal stress UspA family protein